MRFSNPFPQAAYQPAVRFLRVGVLFAALTVATAYADTLTYNPDPTLSAGWSTCASFAGYTCLTTAFFGDRTLDFLHDSFIDGLFSQAWTAGNNGGYTLAEGTQGLPNGVTFTVTQAAAQQFAAGQPPGTANANVVSGGEVINVHINGALPELGENRSYVWVQGLQVDYTKTGSIVNPYFVMDTATLSGFTCPTLVFPVTVCAPLYPFQNGGNAGFGDFFDQPSIGYQAPGSTQGFFNADVYLAIRNTSNTSITLLDGVNYGFNNFVSPEPGTWLMLVSGGVIVFFMRRKITGR